MIKAEQERFDKMWDVLVDIKTSSAVASEQNKNIISQIGALEKRQTNHEELNTARHKENKDKLDSLSEFQGKQTTTKKIWDKIFSGVIAVGATIITWYIAIHYK